MDLPALEVFRSRRILIADDNAVVRGLLCAQLHASGRYEVVGEAGDGQEAVRLAAALKPDVMILDLSMPVMDGLQALPLILAAAPGMPVIVLSGFDENKLGGKALAAGAARYLEKGIRMDLAQVIDEIVDAA